MATHSHVLVSDSHMSGQLHGLDVNPANNDEFATAGDDGVLKVWSIQDYKCIRKCYIDSPIRCLAWSNDGSTIVLGLGCIQQVSSSNNSVKDGISLM